MPYTPLDPIVARNRRSALFVRSSGTPEQHEKALTDLVTANAYKGLCEALSALGATRLAPEQRDCLVALVQGASR
jgi:hypothetical protein